jgi:hypothetical protein
MTTAGSVGSNTPVTISSVPALVSVQAFGRCAANSAVTLSGGNVTPQIPSSTYTTLPGYMVNSSTPNTPFPFALYTLPATGTAPVAPGGTINAASTGSANLTCYNDGWIWHRGK